MEKWINLNRMNWKMYKSDQDELKMKKSDDDEWKNG